MKELEFHEIAGMFPLISEEKFKEFKEDIKKNGLREPIVLYEGKILDGRNRYKACKELNIEPETKVFSGNDPMAYIISKNLFRRHLNLYQKTKIAMLLLPKYAKEARKQQGRRTDLSVNSKKSLKPIDAVKEACKIVGIGTSSFYEAKFIQKKIEERRRTDPTGGDLADVMEGHLEGGFTTLNRAYIDYSADEQKAKKAKKDAEQAKIDTEKAEKEREEVLKERRKARKAKAERLKAERPLILWQNLKNAINEFSEWYYIHEDFLKDKTVSVIAESMEKACEVLGGIKSKVKQKVQQKTDNLLQGTKDITKGMVSKETTKEVEEKPKIIDAEIEEEDK